MSEHDEHDPKLSASDDALLEAMKGALREDGPESSKVATWAAAFDLPPGGGGGPDPTPAAGRHFLWVVAGGVAAVLVGAGVWWTGSAPSAQLPNMPSSPTAEPSSGDRVGPVGSALPAPSAGRDQTDATEAPQKAGEDGTAEPAAETRTVRQVRPPSRVAEQAPVHTSDAVSEAALIRRARSLLATAPARAEGVLAEHGRDYPEGVLAEERDALAIEARIALGDREGALRKLSRFERAYPGSAHRERIHQTLDQAP